MCACVGVWFGHGWLDGYALDWLHRGCNLVGFLNSPLTSGVTIQTHMSIMPWVCLWLGMVWAWLVGMVGFGFGFIEVAVWLGFEIPL